MQTKC
ncbi:acyl-CoA dehydrogenase, N-terminal domain protein, partial [Vibrio parahaemolyticus V-223/04]